MPTTRTNVTKQACDACKIRKIRCGGGQPCWACHGATMKCTYVRVPRRRGPQRIRPDTQQLIEQTQCGSEEMGNGLRLPVRTSDSALDASTVQRSSHIDEGGESPGMSADILAPILRIFHSRMYPIWPIVSVDELVSALEQDEKINGGDTALYALATAVAAVTTVQLQLGQWSGPGKLITADDLAKESLCARSRCHSQQKVTLNGVRTSFFLHIYYGNQEPGGAESLLYLREAISLAQMMNLHRESSYGKLPETEQQLHRRVLWLLFVTERGACILHRYPVVLKPNISLPKIDASDDLSIVPAFIKLLTLFRVFDQSGMFDILLDDECESLSVFENGRVGDQLFEILQAQLHDGSTWLNRISDVQKADLGVTRHWMRMIIWRLSARKKNVIFRLPSNLLTSPCFPVTIVQELLAMLSQLPQSAVEAHGPGINLKIYEIANSLADAIVGLSELPSTTEWALDSRSSAILTHLQATLSTFRRGVDRALVNIVHQRLTEIQLRHPSIASTTLGMTRPMARNDQGSTTRFINLQHSGPSVFSAAMGEEEAVGLLGARNQSHHLLDAGGNGRGTLNDEDVTSDKIHSGATEVSSDVLQIRSTSHLSYAASRQVPQGSARDFYAAALAAAQTMFDTSNNFAPLYGTSESQSSPPWMPIEEIVREFVSSIPGARSVARGSPGRVVISDSDTNDALVHDLVSSQGFPP